ncbi:hypothetical protein [Sphingomonas alba]|uniref:3-keto-disaccharide hydrolase domain-containing protein n=1 Tax=Sphingomonas alba TaxID=2908208 RepID=A0ABT0RPZ3_9SPHN|nr:hypothetical protein [Sphingomonas alba]MCL6684716.1 hypothetical protein [Sphingomonas alba]
MRQWAQIALPISLLWISSQASAHAVFHDAPFDEAHWTFAGADVHPTEALGQKALRLQDGVATLKIPDLASGIVEFDILFASEAPMYSGLRFHGRDRGQYEYFYLRADRSGMADSTEYTPVFNGDQGWQIYAGPEFSSEEGFKRGGWNHVQVRIYPDSADVFMNGHLSLRIPELKTGQAAGYVSFASSFGPRFPFNQTFYANVRYSLDPISRPADMPVPSLYAPAGLVRRWRVSHSMPQADALAIAAGKAAPATKWADLKVETNGIANLARVAAKSGDSNAVVAQFEITADKDGSQLMRFGYSDTVDMFVNGRQVFQGDATFISRDLQFLGTVGFKDAVSIPLRRGANQVAFVVKESYGGWAAAAEFVEPRGLAGAGLPAAQR